MLRKAGSEGWAKSPGCGDFILCLRASDVAVAVAVALDVWKVDRLGLLVVGTGR